MLECQVFWTTYGVLTSGELYPKAHTSDFSWVRSWMREDLTVVIIETTIDPKTGTVNSTIIKNGYPK